MDFNFTEERFKELYFSTSRRQVEKILGISDYTFDRIKHYLELPDKKKGRPRKKTTTEYRK